MPFPEEMNPFLGWRAIRISLDEPELFKTQLRACLLYTSDAADERSSVDLGGRRIIKKKKLYSLV